MSDETNEGKDETNKPNPETEAAIDEPMFPDGETPVFVGGTQSRLSRTAAFSAESPGANCVTGLPATKAALRIPLFHGRYEIESRPLGAEETRVTVIETRDGARRIIGEVSIKTRSAGPEVVFQDYISCLDLDHSVAVECAEADAAARLVPEMAGSEYDALVAVLPEGAEVRPYAIDEGQGPKTLYLRPASTTSGGGFFRTIFDGWMVAGLPDGSSYVVGFEVDYEEGKYFGRPIAEGKGREFACRTLREHITSGIGDDALEVMESCGYLPRAGQIKVRRAPLAEGAAG